MQKVQNNCCELQFISEPDKVRDAVGCLLNFIDGYSPVSEVGSDLKLIFNELLFNAIIHGNKEDRTKRVHVQARMINDLLVATIQDEGPGFDYRQILEYSQTKTALFNEHGRGMVLVCGLTDNISFNETGNIIRFEKRLK